MNPRNRGGRAFDGAITTTINPLDESIETATAVFVQEATTNTADETTSQCPHLQGNKAEHFQINPIFPVKSDQTGLFLLFIYSVK